MSENSLSITNIKEIDALTEALTLIRQDLARKEKKLSDDIGEFLEFLEKDEVKEGIPYALQKANRTEYKPMLQTLMRSLTYAIATAKSIRQELYNTPNEQTEFKYPEIQQVQGMNEDEKTKMDRFKQAIGMKRTVSFDPNSPMAKMEELVAGLTVIIDIFKRWLIWYEGLIFEKLMFNTPDSLQIELNQLVEIFGHTIETNIWISFQYYRDLREQDAERHAVTVVTALQKQQDKERNDQANIMKMQQNQP